MECFPWWVQILAALGFVCLGVAGTLFGVAMRWW